MSSSPLRVAAEISRKSTTGTHPSREASAAVLPRGHRYRLPIYHAEAGALRRLAIDAFTTALVCSALLGAIVALSFGGQ